MPLLGTLAVLLSIEDGTILVTRDASTVRLVCPVNRTTRVVFPEPLRQLKSRERETTPLGLRIEQSRPHGVIVLHPTRHPAQATLDFRGPTLAIQLVLTTAPTGESSEVKLVLSPPSVASPASSPPPTSPTEHSEANPPTPASAPTPNPRDPTPPQAPPTASPTRPDPAELFRARPVAIDRREGLPGQRPMILVDALHGDRWIWLRFRVEDGAGVRVDRVWWEHGDVPDWVQEPEGTDLRVVVPLPRTQITDKTRVFLKIGSGAPYRFGLKPSTLPNALRDLLR